MCLCQNIPTTGTYSMADSIYMYSKVQSSAKEKVIDLTVMYMYYFPAGKYPNFERSVTVTDSDA